jgi:hypothetical protein
MPNISRRRVREPLDWFEISKFLIWKLGGSVEVTMKDLGKLPKDFTELYVTEEYSPTSSCVLRLMRDK